MYCWQKNPPTCPGQDEIEDVQEQLEQFELMEFTIPEDIFTEPPPMVEYNFMPTFEEEIEIEEVYDLMPTEFFLNLSISKKFSWKSLSLLMLSWLKI